MFTPPECVWGAHVCLTGCWGDLQMLLPALPVPVILPVSTSLFPCQHRPCCDSFSAHTRTEIKLHVYMSCTCSDLFIVTRISCSCLIWLLTQAYLHMFMMLVIIATHLLWCVIWCHWQHVPFTRHSAITYTPFHTTFHWGVWSAVVIADLSICMFMRLHSLHPQLLWCKLLMHPAFPLDLSN